MGKEFMLYIRNNGDAKASMTAAEHLAFVKKCEAYIGQLKDGGHLIAAQPLLREAVLISKDKNGWNSRSLDTAGEIQVGYYHILAKDLEAAIVIAKNNPEFEFVAAASIEVHTVKTKEAATNFVYPAG